MCVCGAGEGCSGALVGGGVVYPVVCLPRNVEHTPVVGLPRNVEHTQ